MHDGVPRVQSKLTSAEERSMSIRCSAEIIFVLYAPHPIAGSEQTVVQSSVISGEQLRDVSGALHLPYEQIEILSSECTFWRLLGFRWKIQVESWVLCVSLPTK